MENENTSTVTEVSVDLSEEGYNTCFYIVPTNKATPELEWPTRIQVSVVLEDGPILGLDDQAELEEDLDNLQFYNVQDLGNIQID